jgi:hypothetical protein|tara:strand:- start:421 stop:747 length:327 start_codon:yes stop_codon:yes gene_type:complete
MKTEHLIQLKGKLAKGKTAVFEKFETEGDSKIITRFRIWSLSCTTTAEEKCSKEEYVALIEKHDSKYVANDCPMIIDEKKKFATVEEAIKFASDNNYLEKEEVTKYER